MATDSDSSNIIWFHYTGEEDIPYDATHITVHVAVIPAEAFYEYYNIVEVICHFDVKKIEEEAFYDCEYLKRFIMPGVEVVERGAFSFCDCLTDVECGKLEIVKEKAFQSCTSLKSMDLPSVRIVEEEAFINTNLESVKFGSKLERIQDNVFYNCFTLERLTIPLKEGLYFSYAIKGCDNLNHVDLVEAEQLHETIAALQLEDWKNDMNEEINSINKILPTVDAGGYDENGGYNEFDAGEKSRAIRRWITSVRSKIVHYKAEHQRLLDEAASTVQFLPNDVVKNYVLPFLALPPHTFE